MPMTMHLNWTVVYYAPIAVKAVVDRGQHEFLLSKAGITFFTCRPTTLKLQVSVNVVVVQCMLLFISGSHKYILSLK